MRDNLVFGNADLLNPGLATSRSVHAMPPGSPSPIALYTFAHDER